MKKKAKQKPSKKTKKSAQHHTSYQATLTCVFLLPIVLALGLSILEGITSKSQTKARLGDFFKGEFTRQATLAVAELSNIAPSLARTPGLADKLLKDDRRGLAALEKKLLQHYPGLKSVRIIKHNALLGRNGSNAQSTSFTEQAMLRKIEKGDPLALELSKTDNLTVIRHGAAIRKPGSPEGPQVGSLLITLNSQAFTKFFSNVPQEIGYFSLSQRKQKDKEITWYETGNTQLANQTLFELLELGHTQWRLTYASAGSLSSHAQRFLTSAAGGLITSILLSLMVIMLRRTWLEAIERNLQRLTAQFKTNRTKKVKATYNMPGFEACHRNISGVIESLAQKTATQSGRTEQTQASSSTGGSAASAPQDLLDMDLDLADDDLFESVDSLGGDFMSPEVGATESAPAPTSPSMSPSIFREYDIRGIVGETLNGEIVTLIGRAIGTRCRQAGETNVVIGRDGRHSSESLAAALTQGLTSTGCNVIDIGMVPTPLTYFAAKNMDTRSAVMITGSHNPPDYNGLKIVIKGETLYGQGIQELLNLINAQQFMDGTGSANSTDISESYLGKVADDIVIGRSLKVAVDAGNGVAGPTIVALLQTLGCDVVSLYCDIDGSFPNHHPDPSKPENLAALVQTVQAENADVGIALDGDGDRLGVVTPQGKIIYPDRLLMLFAKDILTRNPGGEIIFDVKCTSDLHPLISSFGGRPIMWKTGHSLMKAKLKETGALIAAEMSGHIFFNDRWYGFDDALYSAARLLEILAMEGQDLDSLMAALPERISTPEINIPVTEDTKFQIMDALSRTGEFQGNVVTLDGIRVDYSNGWGLVRASNTTPNLVARFEADTDESLKSIQNEFRKNLQNVDPNLSLPF